MEPQAALIGADRGVVLDAETAVDLDVALVVHPRDAELNEPLGLDDPVDDARLYKVGTLGHDRLKRFEDLPDRLQKLRFVRVALAYGVVDALQICTLKG